MGQESKPACGTEQLAGGVEAGIEGAIHAARLQWAQHFQEEDWGFLLIDARNAFNDENRTAMLWAVRNEWPSGAQFTFNFYPHWATLGVRNTADGSVHFLHSKEGMTQGDPLAMITYGIGVLPLIRVLRTDHPQVSQPWYADDAGAGGKFGVVMPHFRDLQLKGPAQGYFSEPTKSILVVSVQNLPRATEFFRGMGVQIVTGSRYLGGFVGEWETERQWFRTKVD